MRTFLTLVNCKTPIIALFIFLFYTVTGFSQSQTVIYNTTGNKTWTAPCGVTSITVQAWGGGGAGGGSIANNSKGGAGGAGGTYVSSIISVTPNNTYNLFVGTGASGSSGAGAQGGFSWFGTTSTLYAEGGKGGAAANGGTVLGGIGSTAASIGTIKIAGANGANGTATISGAGGTGANSGGAGGTARTTSGTGNSGSQPGGGGGGAFIGNSTNQVGGDGGSGQIIITYNGIASYCIPSFSQDVEPITLVQFAGINNSSSNIVNGSPAVESFCLSGTVTQGGTYPITVKGNTNDDFFTYTDNFKVFVDWNQNGILDPGEATPLGTITGSNGVDSKSLTGNITVPATAVIGTTRMRVIKSYGGYGNACDAYSYGQAEDYLVNVNGLCTQPTGATANGLTGTLTTCLGIQDTLKQIGGTLGAGASWKWYTGSCGGALVNTNNNADGSYIFTPSVAGTTTYYVRAEGGSCGTGGTCKSVTVVVNAAGTITVSSGNKDFSVCSGINNGPYVKYTITGATGATFSGLPSGITATLAGNVYTVSGSTTVPSGSYPYTVTLTGNAPCTNPAPLNGTITVNTIPTSFSYTTSPVTYCTNALITPNNPVVSGGNFTSYAVVGTPLPMGLSVDPVTGIISGTPTTVVAAANYTIRGTTSTCGSKDAVVNIKTSSGNAVFNMTPTGIQNVCSNPVTSFPVTLSGSEVGVNYQLYLNGNPVGAAVAGTGNSLSFGSQSASGTYTIKTTTGCLTNMNGSLTIIITTAPNTTFTYPSYLYCNQGLSPAATLIGLPQNGTFSAPSGLVFNNASTGVIDLAASTPGTYSITYVVAASGGCGIYTSPAKNFTVSNTPQVFNVYGGGGYCSGGAGVEVGLDNSEVGITYQLYRNGTTLVTSLSGTGTLVSFGNQTIAGTYTIVATPCNVLMNGSAVITVNPLPGAVIVAPASTTVCQGAIVPLSVSLNPPTLSTGSVNLSSGNISLSIPNNSATGVSNLLKVVGIPNGATITSISIGFKVVQDYDGDLIINLKGPNGNVLNIANKIGGTGDDFNNTTVSSNATTNIALGNPAYTGTYLPQAVSGVAGAQVVTLNTSNVTVFSGLYGASATSANGNWILSVRDVTDHTFLGFPLDGNGTFSNWSITINYSYVSNPVKVTWTPATDLYTDPGAAISYLAGDSSATIYAKTSTTGLKTYTATSTNSFGCSTTSSAIITVNKSPVLTMLADYCSRSAQNQVEVTANSDISISNWQWSGGLVPVNSTTLKSVVRPNSAGTYYVTATSSTNSCTTTSSMSVSEELTTNGDFESGNVGFTSGYTYVSNTIQNGLYPEGTYSVNNNPNFNHDNFWGTDHTTANGTGNFMLVNGVGGATPPVIWSETVTVLPNTVYYFSAYATSLNNISPFANLQFKVNGVAVGTNTGALPSKSLDNNPGTWLRFYGNWNSGTATTAQIQIVDLTTSAGGNDFGLDDISFGTLSTFLNLTSPVGSNNQSNVCANVPIDTISYEVGGDGSQPVLFGFPTGLSTYWNGRDLIITGTPTQSGTFNYSVSGTGCNMRVATGKIIVKAPSAAGNFANSILSDCYGANGSVSLVSGTTVGNIIKWQSSPDNSTWTDIVNITTTQSYTNLQTPVYYRAIAQNGSGCSLDTSASAKLGIHNYWTGISSNVWALNTNWSDNQSPSFATCNTVVIPAGTPFSPQLSSATTVQNINIFTGAKLDLNGQSLTITGTYSGTGTLTGSPSAQLTLTGNTGTLHFTPNVYPGAVTNNYLKTLTVNNTSAQTAIIGDSLNIAAGTAGNYGTVKVTGGTLNANGNLILKSNAGGDAQVLFSTGNITGEATVERYIPGRRAWRFISVPFSSSSQSIHDAWQEGVNNYGLGASFNQNPHPGFGTHITGNNYSNLGFDYNTTTNQSMRVWDSIANTWNVVEPPTISTGISSHNAYYLFVRGSRAVDLSQGQYAGTDPTVLRMKGVLNQTGNPNILSKTFNGKVNNWIFVGNPYASPFDIKNILNTTGIAGKKFWVWDPKLSNPNWGTVGAYVTYDGTSNTMVPLGGSYTTATTIMQSGQGFLLQLDGTHNSASLTFNEADKATSEANVYGFTNAEPQPSYPTVYTNLLIPGNEEDILTDGVATVFSDNFSSIVNNEDAIKSWGYYENISQVRDGQNLSIELRPQVKLTDTIFLRVYVRSSYPAYTLQLFTQNINLMPLTRAWLVDKYLNTKTEVNLHDTTLYSFTPNSDVKSYLDRFMLVFNRQLLTTPVPITKVANQQDPNTTGIANSTAVTVSSVSISPNPVTTAKNAMLRFSNMTEGYYEVVVYSAKGQKLAIKKIQHDGSNTFYPLPEGNGWSAGIYSVSVYNEDTKTTINLKLVISK